MSFDVSVFKAQNNSFISDFELSTNRLKAPNPNLQLDTKSSSLLKNNLSTAQRNQKEKIKFYENNEKSFKALKRYGDVLHLIENLLGLIPSDLHNLSLDELCEKLEEFTKSKKKNDVQMIFIFFQNLYLNTIQNLLNVENDFQQGRLSSVDALKKVQTIKAEVQSNEKESPKILKTTNDEVNYLITLYEESYNTISSSNDLTDSTPLKTTKLDDSHQIMLQELNNHAKGLMSKIDHLASDLSSFEPQVDLTKLITNLKDAEKVVEVPNFSHDELNVAVAELETTTNALTREQIEKNNLNEKLTNDIDSLENETMNLSHSSIKKISQETFKDAAQRALETKELTKESTNLVDENIMSTELGTQVANTVIAQMDADIEFCDKVSIEPNADNIFKDTNLSEESFELAEILKDHTLTLEEKQNIILTLTKDEDDKEKKNRS